MRLVDATLLSRLLPTHHGARGIRQQANIREVGLFLPAALTRFSITTMLRQVHFLAQVCEESWGLSDLEEEASGVEYEGRKNLGNTRPGDGIRYTGRGLVQLAGRANDNRAGRELDLNLVDHPEFAETASVAADTACLFWSDHHLSKLADLDDIQAITRRVNGKRMLGLKARTAYLVKAKALLGADSIKGDVIAPTRTAPDGSPIYPA